MRAFPVQTGVTILTVGALLAAARLVLPAVQAPAAAQLASLVDFSPDRVPMSPATPHKDPAPVVIAPKVKVKAPGVTGATPASILLDDAGGVLDHFYHALWETEKGGGAVTRVAHYGDSPTTADLITGDIRSLLQKRFGDAGHGFVLIAKPWAWYGHEGVKLSASGWQMAPASRFESKDGMFGFGGVSFTGSAGASSSIVYAEPQTRFEVWFLQQPGGGALTVTADGAPLGRVETAGDSKTPDFAVFNVAAGASAVKLHAEGSVRLFGVIAEKAAPGIVYDSLGLNGASITVLSKMFNQDHWTAELKRRNPDLVVINYGTNEADFAAFVDKGYEKELRESIRRVHAALPDASILVMSPMDRGYRTGSDIQTMPTIPRIVAIQRRVAKETGCGFFDTFDAMGGEGTMARWYTGSPRLVSADFIHPYPAGGKLIATTFAKELGFGLNRYKSHQIVQTSASAEVR